MKKFEWKSHDMKVIFGDLNFRLVHTAEVEHALRLLEQEDIASLQFFDEYVSFQKNSNQKGGLKHYKEGTMTFKPTYKFVMKTNEYDLNRVPAYTDRILFESIHRMP